LKLRFDVVILGAGPAGATAALQLAGRHSVLMVEKHAEPVQRIGESLPPAARRLLTDMGLWDEFVGQGHAPCYGNRSVWNGVVAEHDFIRDPDGHGWHLDRQRFEMWLRAKAAERGASLLAPATVTHVAKLEEGWQLTLTTPADDARIVRAKTLVDAGGRAAMLARKLGAQRNRWDGLVCYWLYGRDSNHGDTPGAAGLTHIEAAEEGWWYSASLPGQRRVLAFHTDADLAAAKRMRGQDAFIASAMKLESLGTLLRETGFIPEGEVMTAAAHSAVSLPVAGEGWFAAGDAAISFDPLSSQGLFNALYTGWAAAEACDRSLSGDAGVVEGYCRELANIAHAYRRNLAYFYGQEGQWRTSRFWARRCMR
jgi:flavin-dependent dehydrogenase